MTSRQTPTPFLILGRALPLALSLLTAVLAVAESGVSRAETDQTPSSSFPDVVVAPEVGSVPDFRPDLAIGPAVGDLAPSPRSTRIARTVAPERERETVARIEVHATGIFADPQIAAANLSPNNDTLEVDLSAYFSFSGVEGPIVEFNTVLGRFAVELYAEDAPLNVANFLQHANAGVYANTFVHRSVPEFVLQGGGYYAAFNLPGVVPLGTAPLEYQQPNYRGTLAMARRSAPNSASTQWFINTVDNAETLAPQGEGREGYTVIGRVLGGGLQVVDALAALPVFYLTDLFSELPLYDYELGNPLSLGNLVTVYDIAEVPLYPTAEEPAALLNFTASSSNPGVVEAMIEASTLVLTSGVQGEATIVVRATESSGQWVEQSFAVTVAGTAPTVVSQPMSRPWVVGSNASFRVQVAGTGPFTYQWFKDGEALVASARTTGIHSDFFGIYGVTEDDSGGYSVRITTPDGEVLSATAELTLVDQIMTHSTRGNGYNPGGIAHIDSRIQFAGSPSSITWSVLLPEGWTFLSAGGPETADSPVAGDSGLLEFRWETFPSSNYAFGYYLNVPEDATDEAVFAGMVTISREEDTQVMATPDPLVIPLAVHHTADTDGDYRLGLSELLRVIELYNTRSGTTRTGAYYAVSGTVDDFKADSREPTMSRTLTRYHSADIDRDAKLNLQELLRVIELYNSRTGTQRTGQYRRDENTNDGFAPDP